MCNVFHFWWKNQIKALDLEKETPQEAGRTDLIHVTLVAHPVAHDEEDDEGQHRGHDDAADDHHDGAAQELGLHEVAAQVLRLGGEVDAAHHAGGGQRRHLVVVDGQHAQVVVGAGRQVVDRDALAARRYHPDEREQERVALPLPDVD